MDRLTSNSNDPTSLSSDLKLAAVSDLKVWNVDLMNVSRKMVSWLRYLFTSFVVNTYGVPLISPCPDPMDKTA